jgi:hypothetical protein
MGIGGNASSVVCDGNRTLGVDVNFYMGAIASQSLINGVVYYLVN